MDSLSRLHDGKPRHAIQTLAQVHFVSVHRLPAYKLVFFSVPAMFLRVQAFGISEEFRLGAERKKPVLTI